MYEKLFEVSRDRRPRHEEKRKTANCSNEETVQEKEPWITVLSCSIRWKENYTGKINNLSGMRACQQGCDSVFKAAGEYVFVGHFKKDITSDRVKKRLYS